MEKEIKASWVNVRITPGLLDKIKAEAEREFRTISSQCVFILEKFFNEKAK